MKDLGPPDDFASERLLAERLAQGPLQNQLRYLRDGPLAGWRQRDGSIWEPCPNPVPLPLAIAIHRTIGDLMEDGVLQPKDAAHMERTAPMRGVLTQMQAYPSMHLDPATIDPPWFIAMPSGLWDFKAWRLIPANPQGPAFLNRTAVDYDPDARHPLFDAVAAHVQGIPGGETVQRFLGAMTIGLPPDRKLLSLLGAGGDGKGTLLR